MTISFADRSGNGRVPTNNGVTLSSDNSVFGNRSAYFDGASYVTYPDSDDFNFGANDFTIDGWFYFDDISVSRGLWQHFNSDATRTGMLWSQAQSWLSLYSKSSSSEVVYVQGSWTPTLNTWYHIAITRNGSVFQLWVNGIDITTGGGTDTSALPNISGSFYVGDYLSPTHAYFSGYIDSFRIHKGKALWTENFIPPNNPTAQVEEETVLLLHCDGADASTMFTDSGITQHSVTANGNAQISTTQSKFGGSSAYFDGSGDYLSISNSTDWDFGTDDFTIDCWINPSSLGTAQYIIGQRDSASVVFWFIRLEATTNKIRIYNIDDGNTVCDYIETTAGITTTSVYKHIAVVRSGSNMYLFIDGIASSLTTTEAISTKDWTGGSDTLRIGAGAGGVDSFFSGYMDEVRITKGVARWIGDFILPSDSYPARDVPVTVDNETVLLIHAEGDDASTNIKDYGATGHTITTNGNAQISTAQSKFGDSSIYFDGTGDYLSIPNSADWHFGTGDFTIEMQVYFNSTDVKEVLICQKRSDESDQGFNLYIDSDLLYFRYRSGESVGAWTDIYNASWIPSINTWYHVAVIRNGNTIQSYVDGAALSSSHDCTSDTLVNSGELVRIGANAGGVEYLDGYIDELRVTKGIARWTGPFTPPTAPYPEVKDLDTKLLLHGNPIPIKVGYSSSNYFLDSSASNHDVFPNGDVTISSAQSKFGNESMYFDNTGDYLTIPYSDDWDFGSGDFTVEMWVRPSSIQSWDVLIAHMDSTDATSAWNIYCQSDGTTYGQIFYNGENYVQSTVNLTIGSWQHLAMVRNGSDLILYKNGVGGGTGNISTNTLNSCPALLSIGAKGDGIYFSNAYIDEVRISKGIARWTANFTPPTAPYPDHT